MPKSRTIAILTTLVGAGIIGALLRFNLSTPFGEHYLIVNYIGLLWVPMLFIFFVAREDPSRFGFSISDSWRAWWVVLLLYAGLLVLMLPASRMENFQNYYPIDREAALTWQGFAFSAAKWGMYFFCWEFFFRGFLLFGLHRYIGWWAVLVQALAFCAMHYNKVQIEMIASFPAGIILGLLALRAKSFLPCFVLHWSAALTFDLLVIAAKRGL